MQLMPYAEIDKKYKKWWKEQEQKIAKGEVITSKPIGSGPIPDITNPRDRKTIARGYSLPVKIAGCERAKENVAQWYVELFELKMKYGLDFFESPDTLNETDYIEYIEKQANLSRSYGARKLCHPNQKGIVCYCT